MLETILYKAFINDSSNGFVWNAIGGSLFAGQSVILLFFCARIYDQETVGVVSISYAIANLILMIALYGVRSFQVTDSNEKYSFYDYLFLRVFSILAALVVMILYMILMYEFVGYAVHKCIVVIAMTLLKMVNAAEDLFVGRLQQRGFFVVGARIGAIREFISLFVMCIVICLKYDIVIALISGFFVSCAVEFIMISRVKDYLESGLIFSKLSDSSIIKVRFDQQRLIRLIKNCLPLCISTVFAIYLSNIPKYVTDWYLDEYSQAVIGYMLLPVFTIALLNQFIYTPFIKGLSDLWNSGKRNRFLKRVLIQSGIIILSAVVILVISFLIGIPLLSVVYNIDLGHYTKEFVLLLIGGGLYALEYYLIIPITVMRKQKIIAFCYIAAILVSFIIQKNMVLRYGLTGVGLLYIFVNLMISILLMFVIFLKYYNVVSKESGNG